MSMGVTSSQPNSLVSWARAGDGNKSCCNFTSCKAWVLAAFCFFHIKYATPPATAARLKKDKYGIESSSRLDTNQNTASALIKVHF